MNLKAEELLPKKKVSEITKNNSSTNKETVEQMKE